MPQHSVSLPKIKQLEAQLQGPLSEDQQLSAMDRLTGYFIYTDISKAITHIKELKRLVDKVGGDESRLNYHWYAGQLENQLYNFKESASHFEFARTIAQDIGDINQQVEILVDSLGTYINLGAWEKTQDLIEVAKKLLEQFPNEMLTPRLLCRSAYLHLHLGNLPESLADFKEAEKLLNQYSRTFKIKDYYFLTLLQAGIGNIHHRTGDSKTSIKSYLEVVDICEKLEMKTRLSWHYLNVGNGFLALNDVTQADKYFKEAIKIKDDLSKKARAGAYANLGFVAFSQNNFDEALELFEEAEELYKENAINDFRNFSIIANWKARLFSKQDQPLKALEKFKEAFKFAEDGADFKQMAEVCLEVARFYAELEDFEEAYKYQLMHSQLEQQYRAEENRKSLVELEVKYEAEAKKKEAEMLRLESSRLALKALRAQMNPHFLHNCLNAIQRYITSNDTDTAARYLAKFSRLMRQSLEYSDLEIISLEEEVHFLKDYLDIFQKLRFEQFTYDITIDEELEEDIMSIPTMIVQPYVENALEHGIRSQPTGHVQVSFKYNSEEEILCIVEDNGIGINASRTIKERDKAERKHRSMGTMITEKRLDILNKTHGKTVSVKTIDLQEDNPKEQGTRVEIQLPVTYLQKS